MMMMATVLDVVNQVLRRAGQAPMPTANPATVLANPTTPLRQTLDFLNHIYSELLHALPLPTLLQQSTLVVAANTNTVVLSTLGTSGDLLQRQRAYVVPANNQPKQPLRYTSPQQLERMAPCTSPTPSLFTLQGDVMVLYPTPSAAVTLQLSFLNLPPLFASGSQLIPFPAGWEHVLVLGTLAYLQQFLGDPQATLTQAQYQNAKQALRHSQQLYPLGQRRLQGPMLGWKGI